MRIEKDDVIVLAEIKTDTEHMDSEIIPIEKYVTKIIMYRGKDKKIYVNLVTKG